MTSKTGTSKAAANQGQAIDQGAAIQQAVNLGWASIEFEPDGTIISANDNFVNALGYSKEVDIKGKHHRIFCDPAYTKTAAYKKFWTSLAKGEVNSGEFQRIKKGGDSIYIQASYTPVTDKSDKVVKVIKIATDVTEMVKLREEAQQAIEEMAAQEEELKQNMEEMQATQEEMQRVSLQASAVKSAVDTGWASIEFEPNGTIIAANENFVSALGYTMEEDIIGKHHRIFCEEVWLNLLSIRTSGKH